MLAEKDDEKHGLISEISNLSKENYQIRLQLSNQSMDSIDSSVHKLKTLLQQ
jgi:hypothetical protein